MDNYTTLLEILFIFVLPPLLIRFKVVSVYSRWGLFALALAFLARMLLYEGWTLARLGVRSDNLAAGFLPYLIFTLLGVLVIKFTAKILKRKSLEDWWTDPYFLYAIFIPISIVQEVAYRSFLIPELQKIIPSVSLVVIVNAFIFTLLHIIYPNYGYLLLPLAFVGGLAFAIMYINWSNLILISAAHSALNFYAVKYGFFSVRKKPIRL